MLIVMNKNLRLFILLLVLYIGLGLPDSLLSTTWPNIRADLGLSIGYISVFSMIGIFSSMISSSNTHRLNSLIGPTRVILMSMVFCLSGLIIFLVFNSFASLIVVQIIMGLGAGAIDSNVNFIASQNLKVGQINLLHGFWGVGVTLTPLVTSVVFFFGYSYMVVFMVVALLFVILITYGYLNRSLLQMEITTDEQSQNPATIKRKDLLGILIYFVYGVEFIVGTFLATYLVTVVKLDGASAAFIVSCYWGGLMVSRIIMPLLFKYIKSYNILILHCILLIGCSMLLRTTNFYALTVIYIITGYCFGPIFPTFVHYTERVNPENTAFYIGKQISSMYFSIFTSQLLIGFFAVKYGLFFYPTVVTVAIILLVILILSYLRIFKTEIK